MNTRVLELLKNPKNIQSEDLLLLQQEINANPYVQNIRALHLYGIHLFDKPNYQKALSETAAYTTDKKILYQLINGKIQALPKQKSEEIIAPLTEFNSPKEQSETVVEENNSKEEKNFNKTHDYEATASSLVVEQPEIKHLVVNGERNRILFEGEENFLEENSNTSIDLEATKESGTLVTQNISEEIPASEISTEIENTEPLENKVVLESEMILNDSETPEIQQNEAKIEEEEVILSEEEKVVENEVFDTELTQNTKEQELLNPELIIENEEINSIEVSEIVNDDSELSFHATDSFLPEISIESKKSEETSQPASTSTSLNKHEEEMRRLIEEVEKKMKEKKVVSEKVEAEPEISNTDINFSEVQSFHFETSKDAFLKENYKKEEKTIEEKLDLEIPKEIVQEEQKVVSENVEIASSEPEITTSWKPMSVETHVPDSFINKSSEPILKEKEPSKVAETKIQIEEVKEINAEKEPETKEDLPVMNFSFFGSEIKSIASQKDAEKPIVHSEQKESVEIPSNVPGFINTWQSWLKIDRIEEEVVAEKVIEKDKVIESFIENNPKISQLKDEVTFVVKEKNDDISHLMTETLANLYVDQKLYSKAIKSFNILIEKYPEKTDYFNEKIKEVKEIRGKN